MNPAADTAPRKPCRPGGASGQSGGKLRGASIAVKQTHAVAIPKDRRPMRAIVEPEAEGVGRTAARFVAELIRREPDCVLGLATGSTPLGLYAELIRLHRQEGLDFARAVTFNLDEYAVAVVDEPAASLLARREYYCHVEQAQRLLQTGRPTFSPQPQE